MLLGIEMNIEYQLDKVSFRSYGDTSETILEQTAAALLYLIKRFRIAVEEVREILGWTKFMLIFRL